MTNQSGMTSTGAVWRLRWLSSWRYFKIHPWQLLLAVLGVSVGVAAVVAVAAARQAVDASFERNLQTLQGTATHRLVANEGAIDLEVYRKLRQQFPLLAMAPVISERARLISNAGDHPQSFKRVTILGLDIIAEAAFADQKTTALLANANTMDLSGWLGGQPLAWVAPGLIQDLQKPDNQTLDIRWQRQLRSLTVIGQLPQDSALANDVIVVDIALASQWFGHQGVDSVRLQLNADQFEQLRKQLPQGLQLLADSDQTGLGSAFALNMLAMGLLTLLMGVLIVFSTFRLLLLQRDQLFRLQYALGSSPYSQVTDALIEAMAIGLLGTVLGILLGLGLAQLVITWIQQTLSDLWLSGFNNTIQLNSSLLWQGLLAGLGGSLLAITPLLWRIYKTAYQNVESTIAANRWLTVIGLLLLLFASLLLFTSSGLVLALAGLFMATMGYLLLCIPVLEVLSLGLRRWFDWRWLLAVLAARRLQASLGHTGPALVALILAVASIIGIGSMVNSFRTSVTDWMNVSLSASAYISTEAQTLPPTLLAQVADWPEVNAVGWLKTVTIQLSDDQASLSIIELPEQGQHSYRMLDGQNLWQTTKTSDHQVMIGETLAARRDIETGQAIQFTVPSLSTQITATVTGIFQDYRAGAGRVVMLRSALPKPPDAPAALGVYLNDQGDFERLSRHLDRLPGLSVELDVISANEVKTETLRIFDQTFLLTSSLRWIVALVALVGMTGALLALQLERRAELQLLHQLGLSLVEQNRLMLFEAGLLGLLAVLLAMPLGAILSWLLCEVINQRAFGWHINAQFLLEHYLLAAVIGILATLTSGWLCVRMTNSGKSQQLQVGATA